MRFISLCSGIDAASVAFGPLGWRAIAFSEIEPFPSAVLAHHYPHVPNLGDMSAFASWPEHLFVEADAIVGGPPCQAFSVAGKREGLADQRGNLTLIYSELIDHADRIRIAHGYPPVVALYENVPGLLSSADNAFGCLLAGLAGEDEPLVGPGGRWSNAGGVFGPARAVAWRVLDAQFFGLAQRRRRVFVVASARVGFDPGAVLFEWDGVRRDLAPSREAAEDVAGALARCSFSGGEQHAVAGPLDARADGGFPGTDGACSGHVVATVAAPGGNRASGPRDTSTALTAHASGTRLDFESDTFITHSPECIVFKAGAGAKAGTIAASETTSPTLGACASGNNSVPSVAIGFNARQDPDSWADRVGPLDTLGSTQGIAYSTKLHNTSSNQAGKVYREYTVSLDRSSPPPALLTALQVRRLMPEECEALQGFPRGYTRIPNWNGWRAMDASETPESCAAAGMETRRSASGKWRVRDVDGPRYKALGNSWAVPCVAWIGRRITAQLS